MRQGHLGKSETPGQRFKRQLMAGVAPGVHQYHGQCAVTLLVDGAEIPLGLSQIQRLDLLTPGTPKDRDVRFP